MSSELKKRNIAVNKQIIKPIVALQSSISVTEGSFSKPNFKQSRNDIGTIKKTPGEEHDIEAIHIKLQSMRIRHQ